MFTRIINLLNRLSSSLWFVPSLMCIGAGLLALYTASWDLRMAEGPPDWAHWFIYNGDAAGARTLLSTVAGSMITVAGVTFSITMVALSLASSQFGPRLLSNFLRDKGNQFVLGTFISTFVYCLIALGGDAKTATFVPRVSTTVGLVMALVSLLVLIYFIHHVASSIRAEHVVNIVAREIDSNLKRLFSQPYIAVTDTERLPEAIGFPCQYAIKLPKGGYLQAVDQKGLVKVAMALDGIIKIHWRPGHFINANACIASLSGQRAPNNNERKALTRGFILGNHRTDEQDPEYGINQLVEIAVRALSPGVNDPNTAISCIDWLGSAISDIANNGIEQPLYEDKQGIFRLQQPGIDFDGILGAAFDQIRQCAYATPAVSIRMLEVLTRMASQCEIPSRLLCIRTQGQTLFNGANKEALQDVDKAVLARRLERLLAATDR